MRNQYNLKKSMGLLIGVLCVVSLGSILLSAQHIKPSLWARGDSEECHNTVEKKLSQMSLEEQVGQLIMPIVYPSQDPQKIKEAEQMLQSIHAGGILFQKGKAYDQYSMTHRLQSSSEIGYLISADNEWGFYMRLSDAIRYPRNWGLGSASTSLVEQYGRDMAEQCKLLGVQVSFAPVLDVNNNPHNPVIGTRSFGSDPHLVAIQGEAYACGLESKGIMAVAKHFPGHGNTNKDSHKTLPTISGSRATLDRVELFPFKEFIKNGHSGIMVAHLVVPALEKRGIPASQSKKITTQLLQEELGFKGLIFTDGLAMAGAKNAAGRSIGVESLLAGNDVLLGPIDPLQMYKDILDAVSKGVLSAQQIKDKCRKVLTAKWILFDGNLKLPYKEILDKKTFYKQLHREPLCKNADKLWRASITEIKAIPNGSTLEKIKQHRVGILHINGGNSSAEQAFSESLHELEINPSVTYKIETNRKLPSLSQLKKKFDSCEYLFVNVYDKKGSKAQRLVSGLAREHILYFTLFNTPFSFSEWKHSLSKARTVLLANENCEEAGRAVVAQLLGLEDSFLITRPASRPSKAPYLEAISSPEIGFDQRFAKVDSIAEEGLRIGAYPGCQIAVIYKGNLVYNRSFGQLYRGTDAPDVNNTTLYDIASITKSVATAPAIMKLVEKKKIFLNDSIAQYIPELRGSGVATITIQELLLHESGLPATLNFYEKLVDSTSLPEGHLFYYQAGDGLKQIDRSVWVPDGFRLSEKYLSPKYKKDYTKQFSSLYYIADSFSTEVLDCIKKQVPTRPSKTVYSDVGYILLGLIVERVTHKPLDQFVDEILIRPLSLHHFLYTPLHRFSVSQIAPSQENSFLRGKVWGLVDDENAACLGGVAGNASVFANAFDLAKVGLLLLDKGWWGKTAVLDEKVAINFLHTTGNGGRRNLGFVKGYPGNPNIPFKASPQTFGHTGFTGTCFWVDPVKDIVFVFLSNRTYPSRSNTLLQTNRIRPRLMEAFYSVL